MVIVNETQFYHNAYDKIDRYMNLFHKSFGIIVGLLLTGGTI